MSNFTEGKEWLWSVARRAIENPDNAVMTRKMFLHFFFKSLLL